MTPLPPRDPSPRRLVAMGSPREGFLMGLGLTVRLQCGYSAVTVRLQCEEGCLNLRR